MSNTSQALAVLGSAAAYTRLMAEVEKLIRIISSVIVVLEADLNIGLNAKSGAMVPKGILTQLKDATAILNNLTDNKVRLDKSAKILQDALTPEMEEAACLAYVRAMPPGRKRDFFERAQ